MGDRAIPHAICCLPGPEVAALAEEVPTVQAGVVYTAANDPNRLLGRPNGYESKAAFADTRVPPETLQGLRSDAIEAGGSLEVFADESAAAPRKAYIQEIGKGLPFAVEYDFVTGGCCCECRGS